MRYILIILFTIFAFSSNYEVIESFEEPNILLKPKRVLKTTKTIKIKPKTNTKLISKETDTINKKVPIQNNYKNKRPKLVIIMDDITHQYQLNKLKALPFKVTPSIFPPNKMNMNSHLIAKNLQHYMVHLPLESDSRALNRMHKTLFVRDSNKKIRARVAEIKRLFPNVKFLNNHTGSIFSQNYTKSKVLYKALLDNGIIFLDSRTSKRTKFKKIAKEFNRRYLHNDLFIDNKLNVNYTLNQLKRAVLIAKKKGYAIVIGHPHNTTIKALKMAKNILKEVQVVYIDEL